MSILVDGNSKAAVREVRPRSRPGRALARALAAVGLAGLAATASAAPWVDELGRTLELGGPGVDTTQLVAGTRDHVTSAAAFKHICLDTNLDKAKAGAAAEASGWGFRYAAQMMGFKVPVDVGGWRTADADLSVGRDLFFAKPAQCNLTVALAGGTPDRDGAVAALSALLGEPANAAKAFKKDGKPQRYWVPEWRLTGADGTERRVYLHLHQPNQVQFAVIEAKGAK